MLADVPARAIRSSSRWCCGSARSSASGSTTRSPRCSSSRGCSRSRGRDSPFVFVWDDDVAAPSLQAVTDSATGVFNVAGDGAMTVRRDRRRVSASRPARSPAGCCAIALRDAARRCGLTAYGPEQVDVPALPAGAGQHAAQARLRLHPDAHQRRGVLAVAGRPRLHRPGSRRWASVGLISRCAPAPSARWIREHATHRAGRRSAQGWTRSSCADSDSSVVSSWGRPTSWTPSGRPSLPMPTGTFAAGLPATFQRAA